MAIVSECWPPNFTNLDPSEELRLLRARIAQLERQQTTKPSTSNASFNLLTSRRYREKLMKTERELKDTKELVGKTLEQMEECKRIAKLELNELGNSTKKEFEKTISYSISVRVYFSCYYCCDPQYTESCPDRCAECVNNSSSSMLEAEAKAWEHFDMVDVDKNGSISLYEAIDHLETKLKNAEISLPNLRDKMARIRARAAELFAVDEQ
uniref:EF-hand domain-containing protein n=1 Tax=Globodera pallida TaxID=36090 RepID=A0A183BMK0_GLOPA